jgi:hypothetical protein
MAEFNQTIYDNVTEKVKLYIKITIFLNFLK